MKIAIVCYPTFGGSGVVATELGLELAQRGHEIHFITYKQPVRLALLNPNLHYHEVNVPEYPLFHYQPYELALSSKLVDMVKLLTTTYEFWFISFVNAMTFITIATRT